MVCICGTTGERSRRMLKKFVQQGRSECRAEAYPLRHVEGLNDARMKLADFFSILLDLTEVGCFQRLIRNHLVKRHLHTPLPLPIFQ
jgi:hypothetical protein